MGRSPGFGSTSCDYGAQLRLAFASAPHLKCLTLPHNVTRWPVLQKVRGHANNALPQLVSVGFQVLFHSPPGVLFTFPSRYYALSVDISILAWGVVPPASHKVSRVSWYSGSYQELSWLCIRDYYPLWLVFPDLFYSQ